MLAGNFFHEPLGNAIPDDDKETFWSGGGLQILKDFLVERNFLKDVSAANVVATHNYVMN